MPCASIAAWCSGLARTARSPPWTPGWRVLTRPSIISGKPVRSDTSSTTRPASASARRVPPVETRATPRSASARAKGRRPVLSDTERSARVTRFRSLGIAAPEGGAGKRRDITKAAGAKRDYLSPRPGERPTRRSRAGERLCCWSSVLPWSVVADDGVEDGEEFSGCCDEGDHLGLSGGDEAVAEGLEGWVVTGGGHGGEEEDGAHGGAASADEAPAAPPP